MSRPLSRPAKRSSPADSFLGVALSISFFGAVLGPAAASALQSCDQALTLCQDRRPLAKARPTQAAQAVFGPRQMPSFKPPRRPALAHRF